MSDSHSEPEVWVSIHNYKDQYTISSYGTIKNCNTQHVMKFHLRNGYHAVCLCKNNHKHTYNVHRLVASHFLSTPTDPQASQVNHINGNKLDNHYWNLEYVTPQQNTAHAVATNLTTIHCKKVGQFDINTGELLATYDSIKQACKALQVSNKHIPSVCRKRRRSAHGYVWKYIDHNNEAIEFESVSFDRSEGVVIEGYPNYKITSDGRVLSQLRQHYLIPKRQSSGYCTVKLCNNGVMKDFYVHALYKTYFPNVNSQVHLNDGDTIQS